MVRKQILVVIYIIQIIISTAFISWGWKINLNLLELLTWLIFEITGVLAMFEWFRRLDGKTVQHEKLKQELNGYINEHSKELVNVVFKKWFSPSPDIHIALPDSYITAQTPIYVAIYSSHSKSRIEDYITLCTEHSLLKYSDEAKEHIKEYSKSKEWLDCEQDSKEYSKAVIEICEGIEDKILADIPAGFTEHIAGTTECYYILDKTVDAVYREAKRFTERDGFYNLFKKGSGNGRFKVVDSDSRPYVESFDERSVDEFMELVYRVAKDPVIVERIRIIKEKNKHIVKRFKDLLNEIIDDVERKHENLKGICGCCEVYYNELKSLK